MTCGMSWRAKDCRIWNKFSSLSSVLVCERALLKAKLASSFPYSTNLILLSSAFKKENVKWGTIRMFSSHGLFQESSPLSTFWSNPARTNSADITFQPWVITWWYATKVVFQARTWFSMDGAMISRQSQLSALSEYASVAELPCLLCLHFFQQWPQSGWQQRVKRLTHSVQRIRTLKDCFASEFLVEVLLSLFLPSLLCLLTHAFSAFTGFDS